MNFTHNKHPKDPKFLKIIRAVLTKDMRLNGLTMKDEANMLGMSEGTLENKLKPSSINEFAVSELDHIVDITGDRTPLEFLAEKHGGSFVLHSEVDGSLENIHRLTDDTVLEGDKVFKVIKIGLRDGELTEEEIVEGVEEICDAMEVLLKLKASLLEHKSQK